MKEVSLGLGKIEHDQTPAGFQCLLQFHEHVPDWHMMQRGNRGDAIELRFREFARDDIVNLKFNIGKSGRARACDANHLGREINRSHAIRPRRQPARKRAGAAADFQNMFALKGGVFQEKLMIVVVGSPSFLVKQRQAVKISFDGGQSAASIAAPQRIMTVLNSTLCNANC